MWIRIFIITSPCGSCQSNWPGKKWCLTSFVSCAICNKKMEFHYFDACKNFLRSCRGRVEALRCLIWPSCTHPRVFNFIPFWYGTVLFASKTIRSWEVKISGGHSATNTCHYIPTLPRWSGNEYGRMNHKLQQVFLTAGDKIWYQPSHTKGIIFLCLGMFTTNVIYSHGVSISHYSYNNSIIDTPNFIRDIKLPFMKRMSSLKMIEALSSILRWHAVISLKFHRLPRSEAWYKRAYDVWFIPE